MAAYMGTDENNRLQDNQWWRVGWILIAPAEVEFVNDGEIGVDFVKVRVHERVPNVFGREETQIPKRIKICALKLKTKESLLEPRLPWCKRMRTWMGKMEWPGRLLA